MGLFDKRAQEKDAPSTGLFAKRQREVEEEEPSWVERIRAKLPFQKEVAGFLGGVEERGIAGGLEKWRELTKPTPIAGVEPYSTVEEAKILASNIGKQVLALPRFPIDIAQQAVKEPIETAKQLAQYPPRVFSDYMLYISPLSTPKQRWGAIERIAEDPLGLFFAVGITKGGLKGGQRLKVAIKRAKQKKGLPVEEPPVEQVPAVTEEILTKKVEVPKEKVLGKAEMELAKELKAKPVTEKPSEIPTEAGPGIMGGVKSVGQEASVQRVMNALKEAKPLRKEQEVLYSKERGTRLAKSLAVRKETTGEAGFYAEKGQFTGEMAKVTFESIRSKISQTDIDNLFNKVRDSGFLTEFEKLTAREGLVKMFGEHGGRVPTKGELILLEQVFPLEFIETVMAKRPLWAKAKEAGWQLANIPRSVMASFDLSFGGRQGAFAAPRFRKEFFNSWEKQFKIFGSEKAYQASREALAKHPNFMFAKESKVAFTELGKIMKHREELFMSAWAEKIPVVGRGIRASSRAYTSFANEFRLDIFSRMIKDAEAQGLNPRKNPYLARQIADFVNNATGRGSLGSLEGAAVVLNAVFFSPRLNMARMRLLNPAYYIKQPKFVRTQALKTALTASGTAVTILTLSDLIPGVEAGTNPLSADFGKLKIRNTRLDLLAGFGQFMRAGAQLLTGKTISTVTGKETILGEGYRPRTRLDILLQQVEYKESPIASFATTLLKGKDFAGKDVSIPKEVGRRFVPMVIADMAELAKEDPQLLPLSIPAVFGMGLQTYAHPYATLVKAEKEYGFASEEWKKIRDKIEESGFKYKYKKYLEYKMGKLPSESTLKLEEPVPRGLFEKYKEKAVPTDVPPIGTAPPGSGSVGMSLLPIFERAGDLIGRKPQDSISKREFTLHDLQKFMSPMGLSVAGDSNGDMGIIGQMLAQRMGGQPTKEGMRYPFGEGSYTHYPSEFMCAPPSNFVNKLVAQTIKKAESVVDRPFLAKREKVSFTLALEREIEELKYNIEYEESDPDSPVPLSSWKAKLKKYEGLLNRIQKIPTQD